MSLLQTPDIRARISLRRARSVLPGPAHLPSISIRFEPLERRDRRPLRGTPKHSLVGHALGSLRVPLLRAAGVRRTEPALNVA